MTCMPAMLTLHSHCYCGSQLQERNAYDLAEVQGTSACCVHMQGKVSHYVFIASAGAYVPDGIHAGAPLVSPFLF